MRRRPATWWAATALVLALVAAGGLGLIQGVIMPRDDRIPGRAGGPGGTDVVGAVEDVTLVAWGVTGPARVDTGAASSSLDARDLRRVGADEVEFTLPDRLGGRRVRCRSVAWQTVRSSDGDTERRPVVELTVALGARRFATRFTLNDRSRMDYPMLIGRNTLEGRFLVDVTRGRAEPPPVPAPGAAPDGAGGRDAR